MQLRLIVSRVIEQLRTKNVTMLFPLLDLPNELILEILEYIDDKRILRKLACTCHRLQDLAEPLVWRSLLIRQAPAAKRVLDAFMLRKRRAAALHHLTVPCLWESSPNTLTIRRILEGAPNLREFYFESPSCNRGQFESEDVWKTMMEQLFLPFQRAAVPHALCSPPLRKLTKLTLHINGPESPYWTPNAQSLTIFLHPTLKYLKVSCVNIPADLFNEVTEKSVTPLRHLVLEECNITVKGLHGLLGLPKDLETLYLGENRHNLNHFPNEIGLQYNKLFQRSARDTIDALSQQKDSLKSLVYVPASESIFLLFRARSSGVDGGFADFHKLESITALGPSSGFERAVMSVKAPPNLRTLTYHGTTPITTPPRNEPTDEAKRIAGRLSLLPFLRAPDAFIPASLENLVLVFERPDDVVFFLNPDFPQDLHDRAKALKSKYNVALTVKKLERDRFFPPLLYGEPTPNLKTLYDGTTEELIMRAPRAGIVYAIDHHDPEDE